MSIRRALVAICSFCLMGVPVFALQGQQSEFVPISELPPGDQLPAAPLLVAAYAFVWVALFVYLWSIWRRLGRVERDMRTLQQRSGSR